MAPSRAAPGGMEGGGADLDVPLVAGRAAQPARRAAEAEAGPWYTLTFGWMNRLIAEGYRRETARAAREAAARRSDQSGAAAGGGDGGAALVPADVPPASLEEADLLELRPDDVPESLRERVERTWARELAQHQGGARRDAQDGAEPPAAGARDGAEPPAAGARDPSFRRALSSAFGGTFVAAGVFKFLYDSLQMVGPYVLKRFLHYLNQCDVDDAEGACDVNKGLLWIGLMIGSNLVQTAFLHQYFHRAFRTGMRLNCASISLIYAKSLRIAGPGRGEGDAGQGQQQGQQRTSGEIVNLMSVDSQRLQDTMTYLHTLWSGPYQITITLIFLAYVVHWATLAGLAVMLLQIPVVTLISRRIKLAQKKLMKIKDERIKVTNELFGSIKLLKMYGWEESFGVKLDSIREAELKQLRKYQILNIVSSAIWSTAPILTGVATFAVYTTLYGDLDAATAFTALSLFNVLRFPLTMFPNMVTSAVEATIALQRITDFLCSPEIGGRAAPPEIQWQPQEGGQGPVAVRLSQVSLAWPGGVPLMSGLNLVVPAPHPSSGDRAHLTVVLGAVGTGKSGLLQALIGDLGAQSGSVAVVGSIAYASQVSWIRNTSVKDNILFNSPFNEERYRAVLEGCALLPDLEALPNGENTEIGEKGVNLSGGQKQRVALARALYAAPHLLLLDDPLSAVDAEVAKKLMRTLRGPLAQGSSIVLCTNYLGAIPYADQVMMLERPDPAQGSSVAFCGPPAEFQERYPDVAGAHDGLQRSLSGEGVGLVEGDVGEKKKKKDSGRLVEKETERVGSVPWDVYRAYLGAGGGLGLAAAVIFGIALGQALQTSADSWVSFWSDHSKGDAHPHVSSQTGLLGYVVLSFTAFFGIFATSSLFRLTALNAARSFHRQLMEKMLQLPMSFYDTTPLGRVLNRFSKDVYTVDEQLQSVLYMYMTTLARVTATVVVIAVATPWFLAVIVPLLCLYRGVQNYYVPSSRQLKRIESTLRSPIFSHFTETLEGVSSIRAFGQQAQFLEENAERLRRQMRAYYNNVSSNRWLAVRLETLGTTIVGAAGLLAVESRHTISAGLAGLSISYGLSVTQSLNWVVRMTSDRETAIVSVERIREYILLSPEPPRRCPRTDPPPGSWPATGAIEFQDLRLRYRPGLPLVLQGLSLGVGPQEKLGICGRTGAGKSSILNVLLRLVEPEGGRTLIDGVDIATLGLHRLRLSITIIPQDPVLFTGTVRFNLDPLSQHGDGAIWTALRRSHLEAHVQTLGGDAPASDAPRDEAACLSSLVAEQGANFSLGQRQQMCLARALLCSNKILLLDEATSAVDQETDRRIQDTIRDEFAEHTVLCIAHRLATIREFDRVCVVDAGRVAETGLPGDLLYESVAVQLSLQGVDLGLLETATKPGVLAEFKGALRAAVAKEASAEAADVVLQVAGDAAAIKATIRTSAASAASLQATLEASSTMAASVASAVKAVAGIKPALNGTALSASAAVSRSMELTLRRL